MAKPEAAQLFPFKALISPCSECRNFQTDPNQGFPMCPRRMWMERRESFRKLQNVLEPAAYLTETGTGESDKLSNPVYFRDEQTIVVWIAAIQDNRITMNPDGTVATGSILSRYAFDTRYIRCHTMPVLPEEHWAEMLLKGAYKEWDRLLVTPMKEEQEHMAANQLELGQAVQMGGFAKKVNFTWDFAQTTPKADRLASGLS